MLRRFGVNFAQGMHIGKPRAVEEVLAVSSQPEASEPKALSKSG